ncbi:IclR family transcriptional regulator [Variovorax ginsengisoli]|uniref:IclR family transcriptional regulator n=1 Tax=Variovorax ginsengisoli TaxID=363844 RepID=A0ABT8SC69_9BURK|nr:IclR family transcriptional regulator [Variovorax ginsengisoli]MDN8616427.1 IclR family transcriptional regulator [Variovorax ginsengisoli]MDO1535597.1 IclR family transcriptional regulator [Variovorax ginsengisoli]
MQFIFDGLGARERLNVAETMIQSAAGTNKGTLRVLQVLSLFSQQPVWGVTQISKKLECSKNTAFQALDTLLKEGLLVRDTTGSRYQLSHKVLSYARGMEAVDIRSLSSPYVHAIQRLTGESVFLSILVGRRNVCIESVQGKGVTVGYSPLSQPLPLHAGAGSRLLLAYLDDSEIEQYIRLESPLRKFTPTTISDPKALWAEIALIRSRGYACGYEDFSTGATYLSFPVFGPMNRPLAAITVGGPIFRFTQAVADSYIPEIRNILADLNQHSRMMPAVPLIRL